MTSLLFCAFTLSLTCDYMQYSHKISKPSRLSCDVTSGQPLWLYKGLPKARVSEVLDEYVTERYFN